jgi:serine/threonine-protein kinase
VVAVLAIGVVVKLAAQQAPGVDTGTGEPAAATGSRPAAPTVPSGLPPGLVGCTGSTDGALCPTTPACWYGLVENGGHKIDVRTIACTQPHHWEAFAAGRLRVDPAVLTAAEIDARPEVTAVCTAARMAARTRTGVDTAGWELDTQPHQFAGRGWYFYCVAKPAGGAETTGSVFVTGAR